jgi:hypothetical protein
MGRLSVRGPSEDSLTKPSVKHLPQRPHRAEIDKILFTSSPPPDELHARAQKYQTKGRSQRACRKELATHIF